MEALDRDSYSLCKTPTSGQCGLMKQEGTSTEDTSTKGTGVLQALAIEAGCGGTHLIRAEFFDAESSSIGNPDCVNFMSGKQVEHCASSFEELGR